MDHHVHTWPVQLLGGDHLQPVIVTALFRFQTDAQIIQDLSDGLTLASGSLQSPEDQRRSVRICPRLLMISLHRKLRRLHSPLTGRSGRHQPWIKLHQVPSGRQDRRILYHIPCRSHRNIATVQSVYQPVKFCLVDLVKTIGDQTVFIFIKPLFQKIQIFFRAVFSGISFQKSAVLPFFSDVQKKIPAPLRCTLDALPVLSNHFLKLLILSIQAALF